MSTMVGLLFNISWLSQIYVKGKVHYRGLLSVKEPLTVTAVKPVLIA